LKNFILTWNHGFDRGVTAVARLWTFQFTDRFLVAQIAFSLGHPKCNYVRFRDFLLMFHYVYYVYAAFCVVPEVQQDSNELSYQVEFITRLGW